MKYENLKLYFCDKEKKLVRFLSTAKNLFIKYNKINFFCKFK